MTQSQKELWEIQARERESASLARGVCVAGSTHSEETRMSQGGNDQPSTMIGTKKKAGKKLMVQVTKGW